MRKLIFLLVAAFSLGACGAHAHVGPAHAGGGVGANLVLHGNVA
jgi:hypothetical protein